MTKLRVLLWVIAASQILLGVLTLITPALFFSWMGLAAPPADNKYMLGMLAARFLAYGVAFAGLARQKNPDVTWIRSMILVQVIDLGAGLYYTGTGILAPSVSAFPMFNAALFATLLWLWQPKSRDLAHA